MSCYAGSRKRVVRLMDLRPFQGLTVEMGSCVNCFVSRNAGSRYHGQAGVTSIVRLSSHSHRDKPFATDYLLLPCFRSPPRGHGPKTHGCGPA